MVSPRVPLTKVMSEPEVWRGRTIQFEITMNENIPHPGGLFTVLQSSHHVAFAVWAEESPLWRKDVFDSPLRTVFAAKGSEAEKALRRAPRYGRLNVTARVVEVLGARPWLLVTSTAPLDGAFDDASLASIIKAFRLKELRRYEAAAEQFARSARPSWPKSAQRVALAEEGRCLVDAGREAEGALKLVAALAIEDDPSLRAELASARRKERPTSRQSPNNPAKSNSRAPVETAIPASPSAVPPAPHAPESRPVS